MLLAVFYPRGFEAEATFLPQGFSAGVSALEAAAAQFGFSFGTPETNLSPQFYVDLITSDVVLRHLVTRGYPESASEPTKDSLAASPSLLVLWNVGGRTSDEQVENGIKKLRKKLHARADRQTGLVTLSMIDRSPTLSAAVLTGALDYINVFNTELRQSQARAERIFVTDRLQALRGELREAEAAVESFLSRNRNFSRSPQLQFTFDRLQREVTLRQQVVNTLAQTLEQVRLDEVRNTPIITVVDPPRAPVRPNHNWLIIWPLIGMVIGLSAAIAIVGALEWLRESQAHHPEEFDEVNRLARATASDLRGLTGRSPKKPVEELERTSTTGRPAGQID